MQEIAIGVITDITSQNITIQIDKYKAPLIYNMANAMINSLDFDNLSAFIVDDVIKQRFYDSAVNCEEFNINLTKNDTKREGLCKLPKNYYRSGRVVRYPLKSRIGDDNNRVIGTYDGNMFDIKELNTPEPMSLDQLSSNTYIPSKETIMKSMEEYDKKIEEAGDEVIENAITIIDNKKIDDIKKSNIKKSSAQKKSINNNIEPLPVFLGDMFKDVINNEQDKETEKPIAHNDNIVAPSPTIIIEKKDNNVPELPKSMEFKCAKCGKPILRTGESLSSFIYGAFNGTIKYGPFCDKKCESKFLKQKLFNNHDNLLIIKENFEKIGLNKNIDDIQPTIKQKHNNTIAKKADKSSSTAVYTIPTQYITTRQFKENKYSIEMHKCAYCHKMFKMTKKQSDDYRLALSVNPDKKVYCCMEHMMLDRKKAGKLLVTD